MKREAMSTFLLVLLLLVLVFPVGALSEAADSHGDSETLGTQSSVDWWPTFHHDSTHTGYSNSTAPDTNQILWTYTTGNSICESSPAVSDGMVFIGSTDGKLYALNTSTGALEWTYTTGGQVYSSPAVAGGVVYVGSGDYNVYALNESTGAFEWNYLTSGALSSSPVLSGSMVYVGSGDGKVYALNAATGALIWSYTIGSSISGSSPAVAYGRVYIGSYNGKVYALNAATGALLWSYATFNPVYSSPAVADGVVYVGSEGHRVQALNATTGALMWYYLTGNGVYSSPAVADGVVYVGSEDHAVYALNAATGAFIWGYGTGNGVYSSPAVAGGVVYVGSNDSNLYALDASTGALIWSYATGDLGNSSAAVAMGVVFAGSDDHKVYAFGGPETVYINADGRVFPSYAPISSSDNVAYTLTNNITYPTYNGIIVLRNNIMINGNGYTVQGSQSGAGEGISLTSISNVTIKNVIVKGFSDGIALISSSKNIIDGNDATSNGYGIWLSDSTNNTVSGNNATANIGVGIDVISSNNNTVSRNNATANSDTGIRLWSSSSNTVSGNTAATNSRWGILINHSNNNTISGNNATANSMEGIYITFGSSNSTVSGNTAANNQYGIALSLSSNSTVSGNTAANNQYGIALIGSNNNTVSGNNATANTIGIYVDSSLSNILYHNNFMNNTNQAIVNSTNTWDNGYPSAGNCWSNYISVDAKSGPYQNVTGSDGIGDTPYVIDTNNIDHYPLMNPFGTGSLRVTISPESTTLLYGQSQLFNSTTSGGMPAYDYQWYVNGTAVSGATFSNWTFTATSGGSFQVYVGVTDSSGVRTTSNSATVTVNAAQLTFVQTGVGSDFAGAVLAIDDINYTALSLPMSFWWNIGSSHNFSFTSPLVVGGKQYLWNSTSGLSTLQSGTVMVAESGNIVGNYIVQNQITFDQLGASSDFAGTIVTIDNINYSKAQLPVSFSWSVGSTHSFSFRSPLLVNTNSKRYLWTSTTGLSTLQSGSITVTTFGSIVGSYKTQYYLTVTSSYGSPVPSSGWIDSGASVTCSVTSPTSGPNGTRYICTGWDGTGNAPTIGTGLNTTFTMSQPSNITWNWKTQYLLTLLTNPNGLSPQPSRTPTGEYNSANSWWYDSSTNLTLSAQGVTGYNFTFWSINGASQGLGQTIVSLMIAAPQTALANYRVYAPPTISEVKAFYTLDSFFLGNMTGLVPENQYFARGNNTSMVEFTIYLNGTEQTYLSLTPDKDGWFNSSSIDMSQVTSDLTITAYSSTGDSVSQTVCTNVYNTPYWLQSLINIAQEKGNLTVTIDPAQPLTRFDNIWSIGYIYNWPETPMDAVYDIPVPIIGGKYGITCGFGLNMSLQSNKTAFVGGGGGLQFYIADAEAKIGVYVTGTIGIQNGTISLQSLEIKINGAVEVPFKHNYSWNGIGLEVGVTVGGSVSCTLYLQEAPTGNGTFGYGLDWVATKADIALWLGAYAEVGVWVGQARIEGEGKVTFTFHMPPPYFTYPDDLKVEATITLTVRCFWFCWSRDIFTYSSHSPVQWTLNSSESGWIPREWANGNYSQYEWPGNATEGTYLESVYPYANPSVDTSSNKTIMVWTQDDLSKPYIQGYEIYYATFDEATGNWSLPAPVTNDMIPQGDAVVKFDSNGNAVAVWTELNDSSLNETLDPFSLLTRVQLAYAVWNPATNNWSQPTQITTDETFHYSPTLISDNATGNLMLIWMTDNDGNLTTHNDESIYASIWNGTAWSSSTLVAAPGLLSSSVAGTYYQGKAALIWSQHMGNNGTILNDTEIFSSEFNGTSWTPPQRLTNNAFEDTSPSVTYWENYPVYAWIQKIENQSDVLMFLDPYGDNMSTQVLERPTILSPTLKVDSQNRLVAFWTDNNLPYSSTLNSDDTCTIAEMRQGENGSKNIYCGLYRCAAGLTDVNYDGKVNLIDVFKEALAFGSVSGDSRWDPNLDINNDGKINLIDYFKVCIQFGSTFSNSIHCRQIKISRQIMQNTRVEEATNAENSPTISNRSEGYISLLLASAVILSKLRPRKHRKHLSTHE